MNPGDIVARARLALLLQCGGRGERMGGEVLHKPLMDLGNGDTPMDNILQDVPPQIPVFLHLLPDYVRDYQDFFSKNGTRDHSITYVTQEASLLYDEQGVPIRSEDGWIMASKGLMTFVRKPDAFPDHVLVTGGPKVGVYMPDVLAAVQVMEDSPDVEAVAFARELSETENRQDYERLRSGDAKDHPRYARINTDSQCVYEHPCMHQDVFESVRTWPALTGMYLFRTRPYAEFVKVLEQAIDDVEACLRNHKHLRSLADVRRFPGMNRKMDLIESSFMKTWSIDGKLLGRAYFLRTIRALRGFNGRSEGLSYRTFTQREGHRMSVKTPRDVEKYLALVATGCLPVRRTHAK